MKYILPLALLFAGSATAAPATLIIRSGWGAGATAWQIAQPSFQECEVVADHIAKVRTDRKQTIGRPGMWRFNFDAWSDDRLEPLVTMLCVPSAEDVPGLAKQLEAEGVYKSLGK
jgi:hypothetical protein